ncbi:MAG: hypothetical protein JW844_02255 [Candidatus Omnitrophica bacterium]|nr:hypothetical protein [Candidatus Omnitrophota bacterium]
MFSDPILGEDFFGREEVLSLLEKRVEAFQEGYKQNIAILGPELSGKTSLAYQFISRIASAKKLIPIYLAIHKTSFEEFIQRFIGACLYGVYNNCEKNSTENMDYDMLLMYTRQNFPKLAEAIAGIKNDVVEGYNERAFESVLELLNAIRGETEKNIIMVMDEFHGLQDLRLSNPFLVLADRIMVQKNIMYIIVSSKKIIAKEILSQKLSLLFGNFELIDLEPFCEQAAREFINRKLVDLEMSEHLASFLIYFTAGYPLYLDLITSKIRDIANTENKNIVTVSCLSRSIEAIMFNSRGVAFQYYLNIINQLSNGRSWSYYLSILLAITHNNISNREIARYLKKTTKEMSKHISKLVEGGIIIKCGSFYVFADRMFSYWLKNVYAVRQATFLYDLQNLSKKFRRDLESYISFYISEIKKKKEDRILELFQMFGNDLVELDGRSFRLPQFSHVRLKSTKDGYPLITAQRQNKKWLCTFQDHTISESKILNLIDSIKQQKKEYNKKILIALNGMDINAKLYAKEANIWLWDLKEINRVLEIYKKIHLLP